MSYLQMIRKQVSDLRDSFENKYTITVEQGKEVKTVEAFRELGFLCRYLEDNGIIPANSLGFNPNRRIWTVSAKPENINELIDRILQATKEIFLSIECNLGEERVADRVKYQLTIPPFFSTIFKSGSVPTRDVIQLIQLSLYKTSTDKEQVFATDYTYPDEGLVVSATQEKVIKDLKTELDGIRNQIKSEIEVANIKNPNSSLSIK